MVEALISFYSSSFPTEKAIEYVKLRRPLLFNDLEMEGVMKDRRRVYDLLKSLNIDVPHHVYLDRDDPNTENVVEEFDEYVIINGVQINKPLVEKPVDAENHNIHIYYPTSAGGGSKRLFRKVQDRSSEFYPHECELRRDGSYIYEEFVHTQGTDVKVYTVGPDYGHAEARKSPVVDGKVNRDSSGYEVRYPVILTPAEKELSRKIVLAFRQTICGFDILRVRGKSYVCDVNGFSFVKNSRKYYDDASQILVDMMLSSLRSEYHSTLSSRVPLSQPDRSSMPLKPSFDNDSDERAGSPSLNSLSLDNNSVNTEGTSGSLSTKKSKLTTDNEEELRCVIAIIRHGDRTPKQKMKLKVSEAKYLDYYHSYTKNPYKDLKVKSKSALVKFLEITREIIDSGTLMKDNPIYRKLRQIKDVLERWEISGINRKLQMKPQKWNVDMMPGEFPSDDTNVQATELLLILKWGGDLTLLGRTQAEQLGASFRHEMYPDSEGGGFLRLHSTYRHDLKIKASDEGRVMKTAAAFTKGLLELEGQLTPILASLVTVEEKNRQMLDRGGNNEVKDDIDRCKAHLNLLQTHDVMTDESVRVIVPDGPAATTRAALSLESPMKSLWRIYELIERLCEELEELCKDYCESPSPASVDVNDAAIYTDSPKRRPSTQVVDSPDQSPSKVQLPIGSDMEILSAAEILSSSWPKSETLTQTIPLTRRSGGSGSHDPSLKQETFEYRTIDDGLYQSETITLMSDRWHKLYKDFYSTTTGMFDLTKVPDVYGRTSVLVVLTFS